MEIAPMTDAHAAEVLAIYRAGIDGGDATFETAAPAWAAFDAAHLDEHRYVACDAERVLGWTALSPVSARPVFAGVAEVSIYVDPSTRGRGVGSALLGAVVESSERGGLWTLQAGIFPENTTSIRLHESCGFVRVGRRERMGRHEHGGRVRWRDVLFLERRSDMAGRD